MSALALGAWQMVKPYVLYLLLGLAAIGTVLAVLARAKHAGVMQERAEATIAADKSIRRQNKARAEAPRSTGDVSSALRKGKF